MKICKFFNNLNFFLNFLFYRQQRVRPRLLLEMMEFIWRSTSKIPAILSSRYTVFCRSCSTDLSIFKKRISFQNMVYPDSQSSFSWFYVSLNWTTDILRFFIKKEEWIDLKNFNCIFSRFWISTNIFLNLYCAIKGSHLQLLDLDSCR